MDCVEVCPVASYEGKNMLVIKPDECIDVASVNQNTQSMR